jgi:Flp pilus assembly protein TadG
MRKGTFLAGLAVGFIAGARAGRERYEQLKKLGQQAADHPAVKQATRTASEKATELSKVAKDKAAERMPKLTETAKSSATKVRGQLDRMPGRHSATSEPVTDTGQAVTDTGQAVGGTSPSVGVDGTGPSTPPPAPPPAP